MTRIDAKFAELNGRRKESLCRLRDGRVTRIIDTSLEVVKGLPGAGVDVIELGLPFTDPMADGPTIQLAGQRALDGGMTLEKDPAGWPPNSARTDEHHPDRADGLLQPDLQPRCEQVPGGCQGGRHRRADRGGPAAGRG